MNQHQAGELHALKAQLQSLTNELADLNARKKLTELIAELIMEDSYAEESEVQN